MAQGSLEECRYYLLLIRDLGYGDTAELSRQADQIGRMLDAYVRTILASR